MPDGVHVPGLAAHQIPGLFPAEKGKVLHQKPAEKTVPHIIEYALGAGFEDDLMGKAQNPPYQGHRKQGEDQPGEKGQIPSLNHIIHNESGNVRVYDGQNCDHSGHEKTKQQ